MGKSETLQGEQLHFRDGFCAQQLELDADLCLGRVVGKGAGES